MPLQQEAAWCWPYWQDILSFIIFRILSETVCGQGLCHCSKHRRKSCPGFLIFFVVFNGYYYFSSFETGDYYEKRGFYLQGQENPLTLQKLAGPEFNRKGYIDTENVQSSAFLSRMEIEQFYDEALSGAKGTPDIIWNMW